MVEFFIAVWMFGKVHPDGKTQNYKFEFSTRFATLQQCKDFTGSVKRHYPQENYIEPSGAEVKYADFYCIEVKKEHPNGPAPVSSSSPVPPRAPSAPNDVAPPRRPLKVQL